MTAQQNVPRALPGELAPARGVSTWPGVKRSRRAGRALRSHGQVWPVWLGLVVTVVGGFGGALQSRLIGSAAQTAGSGAAALISTGGGAILLLALSPVVPSLRAAVVGIPRWFRSGRLPWWLGLAGIFGSLVGLSQGVSVAALGVAVFTICGVAGSTVAALLIDRSRLSLARLPVTWLRLVAALVAVAAVVLSVTGRGGGATTGLAVVALLVALVGGAAAVTQNAFLARMTAAVGFPQPGGMVAYVGSTIMLGFWIPVLSAATSNPGLFGNPLQAVWWSWLCVPIGTVLVMIIGPTARSLGLLTQSLAWTAGQLSGGLLLDVVWPTQGGAVTLWAVAGCALTGVAVALAAVAGQRAARLAA